MKRNANYTDEPMGQLEVVEDFLPPPDRIVLKEDGVKVTISLSKHSVEFFKAHAQDRRCRIKKWSADCWIPMRLNYAAMGTRLFWDESRQRAGASPAAIRAHRGQGRLQRPYCRGCVME